MAGNRAVIGPGHPAHSLKSLQLLTAFEYRVAGTPVPLPSRVQRLVALLAVAQRPLSRTTVASRLWPDVLDSRANASLRATLWEMPRDIDHDFVQSTNNMLSISVGIELDLTVARLLANAITDETYALDRPAAEDLLQQDLLPTWDDEWLSTERENHRQLRLHALDLLCTTLAERGQFARGVIAGLASVRSDPTRESAHRALIRAHLLEGNRMEALRQYHRYVELARTEMGVGPSEQLQRLLTGDLADAANDTVTHG